MAHRYATGLKHHGAALWVLGACCLGTPAVCAADSAAGSAGLVQSVSTGAVPTPGGAAALRDFNIPALALDLALNRYADLAGQPTLYSSRIVVNRMSSAVHGRYSDEMALRLLLEGTGLVLERIDAAAGQTFLLKESAPQPASAALNRRALVEAGNYPGLVQDGIWRALCADPLTVPGGYRALFRFQVGAAGDIQQARLIGSTADRRRDAALLDALRHLRLTQAPPAGLARQTLTMQLEPGTGQGCAEERF